MFLQNIRVAWKIVKSKSQDPIPIPEVPTKDIKEGLDWGMNKIASELQFCYFPLCGSWSSLGVPMQPTDDLLARQAGDPESRIVR